MAAGSMTFVGVSPGRVLGAWMCANSIEQRRSSSGRVEGVLESDPIRRCGLVAGPRGDLAKYAIISVVVGVALLLGVMVWDARLADRQNDLATTIAERQDQLATTIAEHQDQLGPGLGRSG